MIAVYDILVGFAVEFLRNLPDGWLPSIDPFIVFQP